MNEKDLELMKVDMNEEVYNLKDENGVEKKYRKILEFVNPNNSNLYYIFTEEEKITNEEIQIFPMICIKDENEENEKFEPIENDEEYDLIEEVLDILYYDSEE